MRLASTLNDFCVEMKMKNFVDRFHADETVSVLSLTVCQGRHTHHSLPAGEGALRNTHQHQHQHH